MSQTSQLKFYSHSHRSMVGWVLLSYLLTQGQALETLVTHYARTRLTNQCAVQEFFARERSDQVYLAATKVGCIHAKNSFSSGFIYKNLVKRTNVIKAAFTSGDRKLLSSVLEVFTPAWQRSA